MGWLEKPDFKRAEQTRGGGKSSATKGLMSSMMGKKAFNRRYFALEGNSLKYYKGEDDVSPAGAVNLIDVTDGEVPMAARLLTLI